jgi:hypothetical protein
VDGQVVSTVDSGSLAMLPGTHTVSVTTTDRAGNATTDTQTYATAGGGHQGDDDGSDWVDLGKTCVGVDYDLLSSLLAVGLRRTKALDQVFASGLG